MRNSYISILRLLFSYILLILVIHNNCQGIQLGKQVKSSSSHLIGKSFFKLEEDPTIGSKMTTTTPTTFPKYMDMIGNTPLIDISSLVKNPKCSGFLNNLMLFMYI